MNYSWGKVVVHVADVFILIVQDIFGPNIDGEKVARVGAFFPDHARVDEKTNCVICFALI